MKGFLMGEINVYFKNLDCAADDTYFHEFIVWKTDNGEQQFIRGGPRVNKGFSAGSDGGSGLSGIDESGSGANVPFGAIQVDHGAYTQPSARDYAPPGTDPSQAIITGPDTQLRLYWNKMLAAGDKINSQNIGYGFGGSNSNSVATTLLQAAELPQPKGAGLNGPTPAPGADMSLLNHKYFADEDYLDLFGNAIGRGVRDTETDASHAAHWLFRPVGMTSPESENTPAVVTKLRAIAGQARADAAARPVSAVTALQNHIMAVAKSHSVSVAPIPKAARPAQKAAVVQHDSAGDFDSIVRAAMPHPASAAAALSRGALAESMGPGVKALAQAAASATRPSGHVAGGTALPAWSRHESLTAHLPPALTSPTSAAMIGRGGHSDGFAGTIIQATKDMWAAAPWLDMGRHPSTGGGSVFSQHRTELPSIAPIPGARRMADAASWAKPEHGDIEPHQMRQPASMHSSPHPAGGANNPSPPSGASRPDQLQMRRALEELLDRQGRLPPAGVKGFDPRLTPAWAGQKLPG